MIDTSKVAPNLDIFIRDLAGKPRVHIENAILHVEDWSAKMGINLNDFATQMNYVTNIIPSELQEFLDASEGWQILDAVIDSLWTAYSLSNAKLSTPALSSDVAKLRTEANMIALIIEAQARNEGMEVDFDKCFDAVLKSNNSKFISITGLTNLAELLEREQANYPDTPLTIKPFLDNGYAVLYDATGKVRKPSTFVEPAFNGLDDDQLIEQGYLHVR